MKDDAALGFFDERTREPAELVSVDRASSRARGVVLVGKGTDADGAQFRPIHDVIGARDDHEAAFDLLEGLGRFAPFERQFRAQQVEPAADLYGAEAGRKL